MRETERARVGEQYTERESVCVHQEQHFEHYSIGESLL